MVNITRHSKAWWNEDCHHTLYKYWQSCSLENWKDFKSTVKKAKHSFFNKKIDKITNKKYGPWELMNWVKKCKLPAVEAIQYEGHPCIKLEDLWNALHKSFNSAQEREVDIHFLDEIPDKPTAEWNVFSKDELINVIKKCNNLSAPGPDKLTWSHIKSIIRNDDCIRCCVLSIVLYSFPLWYYNKALTYYYLNILWKIQWRVALWISEAFWTSPMLGIEAILGLVLIYLHLKKLYRQFLLHKSFLPSNHIISNILSSNRP